MQAVLGAAIEQAVLGRSFKTKGVILDALVATQQKSLYSNCWIF